MKITIEQPACATTVAITYTISRDPQYPCVTIQATSLDPEDMFSESMHLPVRRLPSFIAALQAIQTVEETELV